MAATARRVVAAGGLHVIGTERHEALRIDRQLLGRAGRQGDPGSGQFFVSLEDKLLEALGPRQEQLEALGRKRAGTIDWNDYRPCLLRLQKITERKHYRQRLDMMFYHRKPPRNNWATSAPIRSSIDERRARRASKGFGFLPYRIIKVRGNTDPKRDIEVFMVSSREKEGRIDQKRK